MKIRLIKGWRGRSPGFIMEPEIDEVATRLIARGLAVEVTPEPEPESKKKQPKLQSWVKNETAG